MIIDGFNLVDLVESLDGDLVVEGGDLADTSKTQELTYIQILHSLLKTEIGDNKAFPYFGFELSPFMGKVNTQQNAEELVHSLFNTIKDRTELYTQLINIQPFPISRTTVGLKVTINDGLYILAYDSLDGKVYMLNGLDDSFEDTSI